MSKTFLHLAQEVEGRGFRVAHGHCVAAHYTYCILVLDWHSNNNNFKMTENGEKEKWWFYRNSVSVERHVVDKVPGAFEWKEFQSIDMIMIILLHKWCKPRGLLLPQKLSSLADSRLLA